MILMAQFTTSETHHKIDLTPAPAHQRTLCLDKYKWNEYEIMFLLHVAAFHNSHSLCVDAMVKLVILTPNNMALGSYDIRCEYLLGLTTWNYVGILIFVQQNLQEG